MSKQSVPFQAEVKEILNLMVHSLYSQKEIFLRELISNSSDALDKLRYEAMSHKDWNVSSEEPSIWLIPDSQNKTLTIQDNGIGMSQDEVVANIGTIAHSGTREFLKAKKEANENPQLIGQFGVGFYSSFMVADRVTLHTQKAGESQGTLWESQGDGTYTISEGARPEGHGTTITLHFKDFSKDEGAQDFCNEWTLKGVVKKYSDFISFPIKLRKSVEVKKEGESLASFEIKEEVINTQKALWLRSASEIKPEEYKEFYHHISHDWNEPYRTIHFKAEGTQEFASLMFIPNEVPYDFNYRDSKHGLSLYVRKIFIMDHCDDLQPHYLRFVRGLVDSNDLPLNVSREILQKDTKVQNIQKAVVSKVLNFLKDTLEKERKDYEHFWERFGTSLKEGVITDSKNREKLADLLLFKTNSSDEWQTLSQYLAKMPADQKSIYYISGTSADSLKDSPYIERLKDKGFEVLFFTDPVDQWLLKDLTEYKEKKLISVASDELDLDTEEDKKTKEEERKKADEKFGGLKKFIEDNFKEQIKEVRYSERLVDSPACLVSLSHDPSAQMEKLMGQMGKKAPKAKRILEINPKHPVFEKILRLPESDKSEWIDILYGQALLNEGSPLIDPAKFGKQIANLMVNGAEPK